MLDRKTLKLVEKRLKSPLTSRVEKAAFEVILEELRKNGEDV